MTGSGLAARGTVLVGLSGSQGSLRAVALASCLARRQHSRLVLAHVRGCAPAAVAALPPEGLLAVQLAGEQTARELRASVLGGEISPDVPADLALRRGDVFTELAWLADKLFADVIVIGASRHHGLRRSSPIARRLIRCARWPVLVVP